MDDIADRLGPVARELWTAWSRLPTRDFVPARGDFDPMAIVRILPIVSLLERTGPDRWRFRLVGTEIERRWGRKITGSDFTDIVSPQAAEVMRGELGCIVEWPCGSCCQRRVELQSGRLAAFETLRLPLRGTNGQITLVLSCSGELHNSVLEALDPRREIHTITEQQYIDIGAGRPADGALDAGERSPASTG